MLAAAETYFEPDFAAGDSERGSRVEAVRGAKPQARQGFIQQNLLARAQRMAALAAIQAIGRRLQQPPGLGFVAQRPNADFRAGTRSVFSQVKVPFSSSGSRPKWP